MGILTSDKVTPLTEVSVLWYWCQTQWLHFSQGLGTAHSSQTSLVQDDNRRTVQTVTDYPKPDTAAGRQHSA
jgi:hypothetical protein